jgi:hypothetical protein
LDCTCPLTGFSLQKLNANEFRGCQSGPDPVKRFRLKPTLLSRFELAVRF